jgi:hypothetical protein
MEILLKNRRAMWVTDALAGAGDEGSSTWLVRVHNGRDPETMVSASDDLPCFSAIEIPAVTRGT